MKHAGSNAVRFYPNFFPGPLEDQLPFSELFETRCICIRRTFTMKKINNFRLNAKR